MCLHGLSCSPALFRGGGQFHKFQTKQTVLFQIYVSTMAIWADNLKFVKDIIDTKYSKIEIAVAEVTLKTEFLRHHNSLHI